MLEVVTKKQRGKKAERSFDDPRPPKDKAHPGVDASGKIKPGLTLVQDMVANDFMCYRNESVPALKAAFPYDRDMQYVDRFYPNAQGGSMWIDSPQMKHEEARCEQKAHVMLEAGLRYAFVLPTDYLENVLERINRGMANGAR